MFYEIYAIEFKPGTEEADLWAVSVDGREVSLAFADYRDAENWIEEQKAESTR